MTPDPAPAGPVTQPGPVVQTERIPTLDVMRGFALLGILLMNIQSFSMIYAAYFNPASYGDLTGVHLWVWILSHLLADQKFMTLFSMLFGAGIVLMAERAEARGRRPAGLHYRRMLILILLGAIHAYLVWYGDILVVYGMSGLVVYLFWRRSWKTLLVMGVLMLSVSSSLYFLAGASLPQWPEEIREGFVHTWDPPPESDVERLGQVMVVLGVWTVQLMISTWWLRPKLRGPVEPG